MARTIQQTVDFDGITADELFDTYVDPKKHAAAIGAPVTMSQKEGAPFTAFGDRHVRGTNLLLVPRQMIVHSWRAQPWRPSDLDSIVVLTFTSTPSGGRIELVQGPVPDHAFEVIEDGWHRMYWEPWRAYFERTRG